MSNGAVGASRVLRTRAQRVVRNDLWAQALDMRHRHPAKAGRCAFGVLKPRDRSFFGRGSLVRDFLLGIHFWSTDAEDKLDALPSANYS